VTKAQKDLYELFVKVFKIDDELSLKDYEATKAHIDGLGGLSEQEKEIAKVFLESKKALAEFDAKNPPSLFVFDTVCQKIDTKVLKKLLTVLDSDEYKQLMDSVDKAFSDNSLAAIDYLDSQVDEDEITEPNTSKYLH